MHDTPHPTADDVNVVFNFTTLCQSLLPPFFLPPTLRHAQVGNFRVEPPGLFRGRGEHPKMGKIKTRVFPRDVIINIGAGEPIPAHPYPDQAWKEVRHDQGVTWLAYFHDTVSPKDFK